MANKYKVNVNQMRNELLEDMEGRAMRLQRDIDNVKASARGLEDKLSGMDEVVWTLKRELHKAQTERDVKEAELMRVRRRNRELKWRNFELDTENETLRRSLRIYKDTTNAILVSRKNRYIYTP